MEKPDYLSKASIPKTQKVQDKQTCYRMLAKSSLIMLLAVAQVGSLNQENSLSTLDSYMCLLESPIEQCEVYFKVNIHKTAPHLSFLSQQENCFLLEIKSDMAFERNTFLEIS